MTAPGPTGRGERNGERRAGQRRRKWAAGNTGNRAARAELLSAIAARAGAELDRGAILDAGCGTGWLLEALERQGIPAGRLHGLDLDPERVQAARRRVPGAHVEVGDVGRLPYPDGTFAVVLFIVSLSSMGSREDARSALREGVRVLALGGVLLCYEPRVPTPLNRSTRLLRAADLKACGLDPGESETLTVLPPLARSLGRGARRLYPQLARVPGLRTHRLYRYRP